MLRLLLPPNLATTALRDAIAVKVEVDLGAAPSPALLPALAALQRFGAQPAAVLFLQLTRAQLRELVTALRGQPVFAWVNAPAKTIFWIGPILRGVSEHLGKAEEPASAPPARPITVPRSGDIRPKPQFRRTEADFTPLTVDGSEHFLAISLPSRDSASYAGALEFVKENDFRLEPSNRKWWLRDRHKVLNLLASHLQTLRDTFHADFTENFERNTAKLKTAEIAADAVASREGFDLTLGLSAGKADVASIQAATATGRGYVEDGDTVYLIDREKLAKLVEAQRALAETSGTGGLTSRRTHRIPAARVAEAQDLLDELAPAFQPPDAWRERSQALRDLSTLAPAPVPAALDATLRLYQRLGVAWMWYLHRHDLGGILADEMGLGKTLQALALLSALKATPIRRANRPTVALVVCPASLVENWRREAARFAPELRVFVHHGEQRLADTEAFGAHDLVITSYGTLTRDEELFAGTTFRCVIADEAQHIKNRRTRNAQALRALDARGRFLLTGTPLENSLEDLRSLFAFLMPGYLTALPTGLKSDERSWHDERLRTQTARYILRRTKKTVAPELPEKIEQVIYCDLEPAQAALYKQTQESAERALMDLAAGGASENSLRIATLPQLLRLRQICCDPRLVTAPAPPSRSRPLPSARLPPAGFPAFAQGRRHRAQPHRRRYRRPLRPVVESRRRGPGHRPCPPHRPRSRGHQLQTHRCRHRRGKGHGPAGQQTRPARRRL